MNNDKIMNLSLKPFINFEKELKKMNKSFKQTDIKFCIRFFTHDYSITGFFTGYYRYQGDQYIGSLENINCEQIKWFKNLNLLKKKVENIFSDNQFINYSDSITIYNEHEQKILSYNGITWEHIND